MSAAIANADHEFAAAVRAVVFRLRRLGEHRVGIEPLRLSEVDVLVHVIDHRGTTVTGVARALALRPSNVSAAVRVLVGQGLLVREVDPHDARRSLLIATDRAIEDRRQIDAAWTAAIGAFLDGLSASERTAALRATSVLRRLADLDPAAAGGGGGEEPRSSN